MVKKLSSTYALLAAACYGVSVPVSKLLLGHISPAFMAALLYLGAGFGMLIVNVFRRDKRIEAHITKREFPYAVTMVALDIAAPILLMYGLELTSASTVSLLSNFEIVATTVLALAIFKEAVGRRMWVAVLLITLASAVLSVDAANDFKLSPGAVLVIAACLCWGIENNLTNKLSLKDPLQIVMIKGFGAGAGALIISVCTGAVTLNPVWDAAALLLGLVSFGLSIYFYILSQRYIGAARTSAYYAFAPFIGAVLSFAFFQEAFTPAFFAALVLMAAGAYMAASERHAHQHLHEPMAHEHRHSHDDSHHDHEHNPPVSGEHSHVHVHTAVTHSHTHTPDLHHIHRH